jgi:hypothetical protein
VLKDLSICSSRQNHIAQNARDAHHFVGYGHASPPLLMNATNLPDLLISINKHASLSAPRATIFKAPSGRGRCRALASSPRARARIA